MTRIRLPAPFKGSRWITAILVLAALGGILQAWIAVQSWAAARGGDVDPPQLRIVEPQDGGQVTESAVVRGVSPYRGLQHHVVVESVAGTGRWVVGEPVQPSATGEFTALARFGSGAAGVGWWHLTVVAMEGRLAEGPLDRIPERARASVSVRVERVR